MIVVVDIDERFFTLNGIRYFKNFIPHVIGNKARIVNAYDSKLVLVEFKSHDEFTVNGVSYATIQLLQNALLPALFFKAGVIGGMDVDDGDTIIVQGVSNITFPGNKVVDLGSGRAAIFEKFKDVTTSRALNDRDHNTTLKIKANVTLTVPNAGLPEDFMCYIDVFDGFELTWATSSGVVLSGNEGTTQGENTMSMLYRDGSTNNYRLRGEV